MRRFLFVLTLSAAVGTSVCLAIWAHVQVYYDRFVFADVIEVPPQPVAIVFGAGVHRDGQLSPMLRDRVDAAINLYRAGRVRKLLVSGDNRFVYYNEPGRMYDYAVAQGILPKDVVRDYAGRRTYDTCHRAEAIFGVREATLVTQGFHLPRALFICRSLGIDAVGLSADRYVYGSEPYYRLREGLASAAAWWDVMIAHPLPVLGEREDMGW